MGVCLCLVRMYWETKKKQKKEILNFLENVSAISAYISIFGPQREALTTRQCFFFFEVKFVFQKNTRECIFAILEKTSSLPLIYFLLLQFIN